MKIKYIKDAPIGSVGTNLVVTEFEGIILILAGYAELEEVDALHTTSTITHSISHSKLPQPLLTSTLPQPLLTSTLPQPSLTSALSQP